MGDFGGSRHSAPSPPTPLKSPRLQSRASARILSASTGGELFESRAPANAHDVNSARAQKANSRERAFFLLGQRSCAEREKVISNEKRSIAQGRALRVLFFEYYITSIRQR